MSKLNRILWTGLVLGIAACGDDVTVVQPPEPTPGIRSVTVAPDGITLAINATAQMTAAVVTDPGATGTPTIAWSTSSATVATVSATGLVTGKAAGSVGITATATLGTSTASGVATVNVTAQTVTPATVSINSITTTPGGAPAELTNIAGGVNVKLNMDRGGEQVTKVQLLVDNKVVAEQAFASGSAEAAAPELAIEELNMPWNSASFNATTGETDWKNGEHTISAKVITVQNASGSASPSVKVVTANASFIATTITVTDGASANSSGGLIWWTGDLNVTGLAVNYSPGTLVLNSMTFSGCGLAAAKTVTAAPFTAKWAKSAANTGTAGGSAGVETANCFITSTSVVNNNPGPAGASNTIRFDNKGPGAPTFAANPNVRQNGWINAGVGLAGSNTSATDDDWLVNGAADGGVGGYTRYQRIAMSPAGLVDEALAATASSSPSLPAPSQTNADYCAVASAKDLLGNESALPAAGSACTPPPVASWTLTGFSSQLFGVDIAPPTAAFSGGLASNARLNGGTVGAEFQVTVADTGTVGNSGMLSGGAVQGTVQLRSVSLTPPSAASCFIGAFSGVTGLCNSISVNAAPPFPLVPTTTVAASTTTAYYTYTAFAQDAAGNKSGTLTRVIAYDPAANVPALTQALYNVPLNGPTATFSALASDNFDLRDVTYTLAYGAFPYGFIQPAVVLNTFNGTPLVNANVPAGITINGFMRQLELVNAQAPIGVAGPFAPTTLSGVARDQANNSSAAAVTALVGVAPGTSYLTLIGGTQEVRSWAVTAPSVATLISNGAGLAAPVNPLSVTLNADAFGPTATFNPPFSRVDFYAVSGANLVLIGSASGVSTVDDGSAFGRRHRYSISWTPGAAWPTGLVTIHAVGVSAGGDGLVTPANTNITVTNP